MNWTQHGDWLHTDDHRFRISRLTVFHGRSYCAYDWFPTNDWAPVRIAVKEDSAAAKRAVEDYIASAYSLAPELGFTDG